MRQVCVFKLYIEHCIGDSNQIEESFPSEAVVIADALCFLLIFGHLSNSNHVLIYNSLLNLPPSAVWVDFGECILLEFELVGQPAVFTSFSS